MLIFFDRFYGKPIYQAVQRPGDVLYVPHGLPHAVHNLKTNIALTKNQLFSVTNFTFKKCMYKVNLVSRTQFPLLSSSWRWGWSSILPGTWRGACTASTWAWRTGTPGGRSGAWSAGLICYEICTAWRQHDIQSPEAGKKKNEGIKIFCFVHSLHSHLEPGPGND